MVGLEMKAFVSTSAVSLGSNEFVQRGHRVCGRVSVGQVRVARRTTLRMTSTVGVESEVGSAPARMEMHKLTYTPVTNPWKKFVRSFKFLIAIRSRVKKGSVLCMTIGGALADQRPMRSPFSPQQAPPSLPEIVGNLQNAAHDPRVAAAYIKIEPVACGYAKLEEIRRYLDYFRQSGKKVYAFMQIGGEKEYFLSLSADEVYVPPEAFISLKGFRVAGTFVRGVFDKIGIEPQVQRIGVYKSAGDQFARKTMSDAQKEVLESLLNQQHSRFVNDVSELKSKSKDEVETLLNTAPQQMEKYADNGWVTAIKYECDLIDMLKEKYNSGATPEVKLKKPLISVNMRKYSRVRSKALGIQGKTRIAVIRAGGAITLGKNSTNPVTGATLGSDSFLELVRAAESADYIKAVVLRIDSPGGVSLAADVMWEEIRKLAKKKPVIASMADVAASGGYYMAMACDKIVAEDMTLTGSIGVVTTKLSLKDLYDRIGFVRENLSIGKFAELDVDNRPFNKEESTYFETGAQIAYRSFVSKAAQSRGKDYDNMHSLAQGRVWTGRQARERGLVDEIGGLARAVELAKEKAEIKDAGALIELRSRRGLPNLLGLLGYGGDQQSVAEKFAHFGKPEMLAMTEFDGSDINPVQQHMLSKVVSLAPLDAMNGTGIRALIARASSLLGL